MNKSDFNLPIQKNSNTKHGKRNTRVYSIWHGILNRCLNAKQKDFHRYGGRGITVCERWKTFANFYEDMGEPPTTEHSINRKDNDGNYEPSNCEWATKDEQNNNKRTNRLLTFQGKTQSVTLWSKELNLNRQTIFSRIKRGLEINEVLKTNAK